MLLLTVEELEQRIRPMIEALQRDQRPSAAAEATKTLVGMIVDDRRVTRDQIKKQAMVTMPEPIDIHGKYEGEDVGGAVTKHEIDIENNPEDLQTMLRMTEDIGFSNAAAQARSAVEAL